MGFMFLLFCNLEPNGHESSSHESPNYNRYLFTSPRIDGFAEDSQYEVGLLIRVFDSLSAKF